MRDEHWSRLEPRLERDLEATLEMLARFSAKATFFVFGRIAEAYFQRHGDQSDALAAIAAKNHKNGVDNPWAQMRKDLGLCLDEARSNGAPLPVAALVDQFYADVQAMGGQRWDTSSLIRRLRKVA